MGNLYERETLGTYLQSHEMAITPVLNKLSDIELAEELSRPGYSLDCKIILIGIALSRILERKS